MDGKTRTGLWLGWATALCGVLIALGLQVRYAEDTAACLLDADRQLILCQGALDAWVLPATVIVGLALVALAGIRVIGAQR